jgi:excisionase family DNA binding protein
VTSVVLLTPEELEARVERAVRKAIAEARPDAAAPAILTRKGVAELLCVEEHHVRRLIERDGLPAHRIGAQWRFRRTEVLEWISSRKAATGERG